jgi:bla regulator protein BlaR1
MIASIAAHLWQCTILVGIAAAVAWVLRKNHARIRHAVWTFASFKFLLPFAALVAAGEQLAILPGIGHLSGLTAVEVPRAIDILETAAEPFGLPGFSAPAPAAAPVPAAGIGLPAVLLAIWASGMVIVMTVWLARWVAVRRELRGATPLTHGREADILIRAAAEARLQPVPLLASAGLMEPGIVGILRPVILWPTRMSDRMTDEQIGAIMLHELVHVRRRDNLLSAIHMIVEAVFWFHPLVWYVGARLLDAREQACDEEVVGLGADPGQYAESILRTCEYAAESRLACVAGVTGADLKRRIAAIARHRATGVGRLKAVFLASIGVACAAGPIAAGALTNRNPDAVLTDPGTNSVLVQDAQAAPQGAAVTPPSPAAPAASDQPDLKFEVASIKLMRDTDGSAGASARGGFGVTGNYFNFAGSVRNLVQQAYQVPFIRQIGGPEWIGDDSSNYRITAKMPDEVPRTPENTRAMIRALLQDRFKLVTRDEMREMPVYVLVHARSDRTLGRNIAPPPANCAEIRNEAQKNGQRPPDECTSAIGSPTGDRNYLRGRNTSLSAFAGRLEGLMRRPVIDRTGLPGTYNFDLNFANPLSGGTDVNPDLPSIFTALQEQLGLKLESERAPIRVVVIQSIERPTED